MPRIPKENPEHGKKPNQKLKPYLVLRYLMANTDENHKVRADDIVDALKEEYGVDAERRSIYKDIEEINKVYLMISEDINVEDAEAELADDEDDEIKLVAYDRHSRGYYVKNRGYDLNDLRLLAECVYSSKFLTERKAKQLAGVVGDLASMYEKEAITHDTYLVERSRTDNKYVNLISSTISDAMSKTLDGKRKAPEKICFKYLAYDINNLEKKKERRGGALYIVSPYKLLISDDNYYLLAFDDEKHKMLTFRLDRMKDVKRLIGISREGEEEFYKLDMTTYTQRNINMYGGKEERVTIQCVSYLLDTVIDRFGIKDAHYAKSDPDHFTVSVRVSISDQFYGWLLGFGRRMKLVSPQNVVDDFKAYVDKIRSIYE